MSALDCTTSQDVIQNLWARLCFPCLKTRQPPPPSTFVHILHDNTLTQDNRDKFIYLAGRYNQLVKFYNVEKLCADSVAKMIELIPLSKTSRLSVAALYRLLIPQVLSRDIEKCIYLDADIVVNLDLAELWHINLNDKPLAAADEVRADTFDHPSNASNNYLVTNGLVDYNDYFNSGVLLMNLNILRGEEKNFFRGIKFVGEHPLYFLDQDVLNYLYSKNYLKLSEKFNAFVRKARRLSETTAKKIYHFAGANFKMDMDDPFNRLWMSYFMKTPFFDEYAIGRLYNGFEQIHVELKNSMTKLSAMMSGKTRAFFTLPHNVEATKEIFSIRDDEDLILAENQASLQKLIDAMKLSQGKKIFFIMLPNFPFAALTQAGFVYGKDFLNGLEFLSEANGLPLNSYPLIQAL